MLQKSMSPRTLAVLKACAAGRVTGSGNVYATGWFNYRMVDDTGQVRTVTAAIESLQHRGFVERPPRSRDSFEPKVFTAQVTAAGRDEIARADAAPVELAPKPSSVRESAKCPDCGKTVQLKQDGTFRLHKGRRPFESSRPATECVGSGEKPASADSEEN